VSLFARLERALLGQPRLFEDPWLAALRELPRPDPGTMFAGARLRLPCHDAPLVSAMVVVHNQAGLALRCLASLAAALPDASETLVVDNASFDATPALLERLDGARVLRNPTNAHFLAAANQAAQAARGRHLLFVNSDAAVAPGAVAAALEALGPGVGAVGGRLVHEDGRLQEAGGIVFRDGTCAAYGRGDAPQAAAYLFRRDVAYVSGAFLLTPRALFLDLAGFAEEYAPAYYEDADYCARLWRRGFRVVYEPRAVVRHREFGSGDRASALRLQSERRSVFVRRHAAWLASRPAAASGPLLARSVAAPRILVLEDRVPHPRLGRGYPRSQRILREMLGLGWQPTLFPMFEPDEAWSSVGAGVPREIETMAGWGRRSLKRFLAERRGQYDVAFVSRPHNMARLRDALGGRLDPELPVVYDAEAIFAERELRRARVLGTPVPDARARRLVRAELDVAGGVRAVVAVCEAEARRFEAAGLEAAVLGHALDLSPTPRGFRERRGLMFVGPLDDPISPNADAMRWFLAQVWPRLSGTGLELTLAGADPDRSAVRAGVRRLGVVPDLAPIYDAARLFVAPTRYAAGIPLKLLEAAAHGVPIVCTSLLAEALGWRAGHELRVADDAQGFELACRELHEDEALWRCQREAALQRVAAACDVAAFRRTLQRVLESAARART
jgi:GT2 family glycosyltransferase